MGDFRLKIQNIRIATYKNPAVLERFTEGLNRIAYVESADLLKSSTSRWALFPSITYATTCTFSTVDGGRTHSPQPIVRTHAPPPDRRPTPPKGDRLKAGLQPWAPLYRLEFRVYAVPLPVATAYPPCAGSSSLCTSHLRSPKVKTAIPHTFQRSWLRYRPSSPPAPGPSEQNRSPPEIACREMHVLYPHFLS